MGIVTGYVAGVAVTWVVLMIVLPIANKLADFSYPPFGQRAMQVAGIALIATAVQLALAVPLSPFVGLAGGAITYFVLLYKMFQIDLWGAVMISIVSWGVRLVLGTMLLSLAASVGSNSAT